MKCPLFWSSLLNSPGEVWERDGDCLKEECGWWEDGPKGCAIAIIADNLVALSTNIQYIGEIIPREGQFRK